MADFQWYKYKCAQCGEYDLIGAGMKTHKCSHCGFRNKLSYENAIPLTEEESRKLIPVPVTCPYCNTLNMVENREHRWKCICCQQYFDVIYNDEPQQPKRSSLFSQEKQPTQKQQPSVSYIPEPENGTSSKKKAFIAIAIVAAVIALFCLIGSPDDANNTPETNTYSSLVIGGVKSYLKLEYLKDPKSYQEIEWSQIGTNSAGQLYVRHKYRAKNSLGGYVVEERIFYLDKQGHVLRSEPYVPR